MSLAPIQARDFSTVRASIQLSPAACQLRQFLRLAFLVVVGVVFASVALAPGHAKAEAPAKAFVRAPRV